MEFKVKSPKQKSEPQAEFINELIYENIDLMTENIKLTYENSILRRRIKYLESIRNRDKFNPLVNEEGMLF